MKKVKQYEIIIVNLDPTVGSEIKKTRPCIVISPDEMNRHLNTVVIAPVTSQSKSYPTRVEIKISGASNWIVVDQLRTVDKRRVVKIVGRIGEEEVAKLKAVIKETFVD